ncbi:hypothetical protein AX774_g5608 [Zancudomyces culisetae]|uniref:Uncharacterized protein n=1 Tax=Zancudomyces culisetae TaxID=1213189 RepID=A0A1R1PIW7_ZANCU|nr:hypothetical protein AX774_g5608 [Zancudomyces culisetae]|eukprot:OMH80955.1 hypothetical protein AX774_g5608 [Zancudomyces culisetae]
MFGIGFPANITPATNSDITFTPKETLVIANTTPNGNINIAAMATASNMPHHGRPMAFFSHAIIPNNAVIRNSTTYQDHGTFLYLFISFSCISSLPNPLCVEIALCNSLQLWINT